MNVLLVIEQCNPEWTSVPLVGYHFFNGIRRLVNVTLVTHERNRSSLTKAHPDADIVFIPESQAIAKYYQIAAGLTAGKKGINWPLQNALTYLVYAEFNHQVYQQFADSVRQGKYDIVHVMTPMMPRYPVALVKACQNTPFLLGPVNGGVPFPKGFTSVARKEFAYFNFLRFFGKFLPGYYETYQKADRILVGSSYTLAMLKERFQLEDEQLNLFYENGILDQFFHRSSSNKGDAVHLLFVGRLVPYKGADMLIEAFHRLPPSIRDNTKLTIVGDGSEREALQHQIESLGLTRYIHLAGWVEQQETADYYHSADIFCFPSIREFGGAVVLEAMACGLPCIVVNNGGIGEYVTEETGFKVEPISREHVVQQVAGHIQHLIENPDLRSQMSTQAIARARQFEWQNKAVEVVEIYRQLTKTPSLINSQ